MSLLIAHLFIDLRLKTMKYYSERHIKCCSFYFKTLPFLKENILMRVPLNCIVSIFSSKNNKMYPVSTTLNFTRKTSTVKNNKFI